MMEYQKEIKNKFDRNVRALTLKPNLGLGKKISTTRITNGLTCEITEGDWTIKTDMPTTMGGSATAPTPGVFGRAALGGCLATGYMIWAAHLDIQIDHVEVRIEADYEDGAFFGITDAPAGYMEVRYYVKIESAHSRQEIEDFLNIADKHSPYLDVFSRAQSCVRELELINNK